MTTLVTGGTGSFGHAYVNAYPDDVRVFSRDEEKQRAMKVTHPHVEFVIGDVRDRDALRRAMRGVDHVFHAAALKQVPQSEENPGETIRTNILGTENVCLVAQEVGARVVTLSTDKAVEPVGVMGASKMLAEAVTLAHGFNVVRYGNVIGSRGSIVPVWRDQLARGEPLTITDPDMTRFLITLDEAIGLVQTAMDWNGAPCVFVKKSPAATVAQMARVFDAPTKVVGIRPGEKRHEHLVLPHERVVDCGSYFRIDPDAARSGIAYSSETAPRLSDETLRSLLVAA